MAEWSRSGLQIRARRFDSGRGLQRFPQSRGFVRIPTCLLTRALARQAPRVNRRDCAIGYSLTVAVDVSLRICARTRLSPGR